VTRVLKIGGRAQGNSTLAATIAAGWKADPQLVIVHGGGDEVTALQRDLGREPTFLNGRRVTTPDDLTLVRMVLSGTVNKRLVGQFLAAGVPAAGISGEDGDLLRCLPFRDGAYGEVGEPTRVNRALLDALIAGGFVPVVSPLGRFVEGGGGCNVNGDDAAAAIAGALQASELLLLADVPGVLRDDGSCISQLDRAEAMELVERGTATGGMIAKLEAGIRALDAGVKSIRIGDLRAILEPGAGSSLLHAVGIRGG
jgi:acetylglutamate kinase